MYKFNENESVSPRRIIVNSMILFKSPEMLFDHNLVRRRLNTCQTWVETY